MTENSKFESTKIMPHSDSREIQSKKSYSVTMHGLKSRNSSTMILTNEKIQNVMTVEDWKQLTSFMKPYKNFLGQSIEPEPWFYSEEFIPDDFEWDDAELPSPVLDRKQLKSLRFWLITNCMMLGIAMTVITSALFLHGKITGSDFDSDEYRMV